MSKQLYDIFAKAKKPYENAFDRDIAPSIRKDKFKRLVDISSDKLWIATRGWEIVINIVVDIICPKEDII